MKELIEYIARELVDHPQEVRITEVDGERTVVFELRCHPDDIGKVIGKPITNPGLYFKIPIIQNANFFPKNLLAWDGDEGQVPTLDKTFLYVDAFARWKIVDPLKFFQTVNNMTGALARLDDIIDPAVRNFVTSYPLIETVRNTNRVLDKLDVEVEDTMQEELLAKVTTGREYITRGIMSQAQPKLVDFGIELVDVQIKRLNYVEQVRKSVYARMIAERNQMAQKFRSEGEGVVQRPGGQGPSAIAPVQARGPRPRASSVAFRQAPDPGPRAFVPRCRIARPVDLP